MKQNEEFSHSLYGHLTCAVLLFAQKSAVEHFGMNQMHTNPPGLPFIFVSHTRSASPRSQGSARTRFREHVLRFHTVSAHNCSLCTEAQEFCEIVAHAASTSTKYGGMICEKAIAPERLSVQKLHSYRRFAR